MAEEPGHFISLEEEVEGDRGGTSDFVFCRIGSSVPLKRNDSSFDLTKPPARPLALSEQFGLLFLAHTAGFLVVKTVDAIRLAKDIKEIEEGNGSKKEIERLCIQERSILDVQIGVVHILAVSTDSSVLAAVVGREVRLLSVPSLIHKNQEPLFTCSIGESGHIKDFLWRKNMENSFLVLSSSGLLYHGNLENHLKEIMGGVEAVDWSVEGNFLAVAKNNVLSILSSKFEQQLNMSLLFQSWTSDAESKLTVKVDSIKWVRRDSIVIGCVQINENHEEVDYMVQVIVTEGDGILEACSKLVVVSFCDLFHGIVDDIVPSRGGPHLLMSYLEHWDLGIAANRKNTDDHVVLLAWSANDELRTPVALEFEQDKFIPRIELQENRDENLLLGIGVDRVSICENLELKIDSEVKVLSPHYILLCLSCEGKLIMFHAARISEPLCSRETSFKPPDVTDAVKKNSSAVLPPVGESTLSTTGVKGEQNMGLDGKLKQITADVPDKSIGKSFVPNRSSRETSFRPSDDSDAVKNSSTVLPTVGESTLPHTGVNGEQNMGLDAKLMQITADVPDKSIGKEVRSLGGVHSSVVEEQPSVPPARNEKIEQSSKFLQPPVQTPFKQGINSTFGHPMKSGSQMNNYTFSRIGTSTSSSVGNVFSETSTASQSSNVSSKTDEAGPVSTRADSLQTASFGLESVGNPNVSYGHTVKPSLSNSSGSIPGNFQGPAGFLRHSISQSFSTNIQPSFKLSKDAGGFTSSNDRSKTPLRPGHNEPVPASHNSSAALKENSFMGKSLISSMQDVLSSSRIYRSPGMEESEPKLSKHFYSMNDMAKELDILLAHIEQEGGFRDACTVVQRSLVLSLEEGLKNLSEKFRMCKAKIGERLKEIQQLQDKRMQVSARQIYMEGLVKQASNGQYWDIWNCQKLGPEFEVKQQLISKLSHGLVNELVELERHFNALELKKYGDSSPVSKGRRALLGSLPTSRQIYSLHSLYNTVNSQLAAAEQLSECLSTQMALLKINSPPANRQSITKELLESIGLEYDSDSFQSPDLKKAGYSPDSSKKGSFLSLSSRAIKEHARRNTQSTMNTFEPETSRRRRDSLDRSWTTFDPPKTIVKRMLQDERFNVGAEKMLSSVKEASGLPVSEGFLTSQKCQDALSSSSLQPSMNRFQSRLEKFNKDDQDKLSKQLSEYQSNSLFKWTTELSEVSQDVGSRFPATSDFRTNRMQSTPVAASSSQPKGVPNKMLELGGLADKLGYGMSYIARQPGSSSVEVDSVTKARFGSQSDASVRNQTFVEATTSFSASKFSSSIKEVQSNESLNMKSGVDGPLRPSTGSVDEAVRPKSSSSMLENSHPSLSSCVGGNVSEVKTLTSRSQSSEKLSSATFSTTILSSLPERSSVATLRSLVPVSASPSVSPVSSLKNFGGSSSISTYCASPSQTSLPSISSVAPLEPSSSTASFQPGISKTSAPLSAPLKDVTSRSPFLASQGPIEILQSTAAQGSKPTEVVSNPQPTIPKSPITEASTGLTADEKPTVLSSAVNLASAASLSLSETPSASSNLPGTPTKRKDEGLDITLTEEDEMEEEAPETNTMLNLGALGGFALGQASASSAPKTNPFGGSLISSTANPTSAAFSLATPSGELFRPASFNLPSSQPTQSSQPMNPGGLSSGFSGFGQPAQIGAGQQALGSVLGAFGQSRQLGAGAQGSGFASSGGFGGGGFSAAAISGGGGFAAAAAAGGGFSAVASSGGGFAGVAGGGFAAMASKPGGFAAAASAGGGFGASSGGNFTSGGFGSLGTKQGADGFAQFGGTSTTVSGKPPAELLMQMRK